jgi:type VI secretion system protein ImpA
MAEGKITGERFDSDVQATPRPFYEELLLSIEQGKGELSALEKVVDEKFAREAPSLLGVRQALDDCHTLIADIVKKKRAQDPSYKPEAAPAVSEQRPATVAIQGQEQSVQGDATVGWLGEPRSRDEAFQQLAVISAYLKRAEPQHPVTYLLDRALRWTKMPLEEWLGEVVRNDDVLQQLRDTLGIKGQSQE